jgi:hypothetical protein
MNNTRRVRDLLTIGSSVVSKPPPWPSPGVPGEGIGLDFSGGNQARESEWYPFAALEDAVTGIECCGRSGI